MIYVITGHPRSGTNMMMAACIAGGMQATFDKTRERFNPVYGDGFYKPNPCGFYEIGPDKSCDARYLRTLADGTLVKLSFAGIPFLPKGNYSVVVMHRHPAEIRSSYRAAFSKKEYIPPDFERWYPETMDHICGLLEVRNDVDHTSLNYADVVKDPRRALQALKWPVDISAATKVVKPEHYRHRIDDIILPAAV